MTPAEQLAFEMVPLTGCLLPEVDAHRDRLMARVGEIVAAAVAAEREACAEIALAWQEMPEVQGDAGSGCMPAFSEGLSCGAPAGIAAAIRARGEGG